jgi:hypothetical protein
MIRPSSRIFLSQFEWGSSILGILDRGDFQVRFGIWSALPMATLLQRIRKGIGGEKSGELAIVAGLCWANPFLFPMVFDTLNRNFGFHFWIHGF